MRNGLAETVFGQVSQFRANRIKNGEETLLLALVLFFLVILDGCAGLVSGQQQSTTASFQISPASVSFGKVTAGQKATQSVTVTNTGTAAVLISGVSASGTGFSASGVTTSQTVNAGQNVTLTVSFAPQSAGAVTGSVTITSNANGSPLTISLSGTGVQAALTATPSGVSFGSVPVGTSTSQTIQLSNSGTAVLTITQMSAAGSGFSTGTVTLPISLNPGQSTTFNAQYLPTATGTMAGSISIISNAPTSPNSLALSGNGVAAILTLGFNPTSLSFGNVNTSTTSSQSVTITNTGNANVSISQISVAGTGFSLAGASTPVTLTPTQNLTFTVVFAPTATGAVSGSVSVTSNASGSPAMITISGSGIQATSHSVALTWGASTSTVSGYNVYRSTTSGSGYSKLNGALVGSLNYSDTTVQNATTYYYATTAVDSSGNESVYSNEAQAIIP